MHRTLINKSIREGRWLLLACAAVIFGFCWMRVWMISRLDTSRFKAIIDLLPGDWQRFSSVDMGWLITYYGRISLAFDEPIVVIGMTIWAIARGSDCVSGELNRGTMEMLLSQPVSRLRLLLSHIVVTVGGVVLLAAAAWGGTAAGIHTVQIKEEIRPAWSLPFSLPWFGSEIKKPLAEPQTRRVPMSEKVDVAPFFPAAVNLAAFGFFWAGVTTMLSAADRYRWRTIGLAVGFYVLQMILKIVGRGVDGWHWLIYGSIFSAYEPSPSVKLAVEKPEETWSLWCEATARLPGGLGPLGCDLLLLTLGYLAFLSAVIIFHRRDLPAPL